MKKFNFDTRINNLKQFESEVFDILIIGGGINGAGVARDAASRGMNVALVEAHDFASGTSSRSSKLIHGGIRYLENYDFKLVFEALSERSLLFEIAPHLVHPLRFMIPIFKNSRVSMFKMGLGMWLYDLLALFQTPKLHEKLNLSETINLQKEVKAEDLIGSFIYSDAYMDDDRLVLETLRSANEFGAKISNYLKVTSYKYDNQLHCVTCEDLLTHKIFQIKSKQLVSCVGPWTDLLTEQLNIKSKPILRPTKGIHLTIPRVRLPLQNAVVMAAEKSKRIIFGIPRDEIIIIGTTDTDFQGDPSQVKTQIEDVTYLLKITNEYFPQAKLTEKDIIASYSGVRPLVKDGADTTGKTSREHYIFEGENRIVFVTGGKYTTYRKIAEQAVETILLQLPVELRIKYGQSKTKELLNSKVNALSYKSYQDSQITNIENFKLAQKYGPEAEDIKSQYLYSTVWQKDAAFNIDHTMCMSIADYYLRRSNLFLTHRDHGLSKFDQISVVFSEKMNMSSIQIAEDLNKIKEHIATEMSWRK